MSTGKITPSVAAALAMLIFMPGNSKADGNTGKPHAHLVSRIEAIVDWKTTFRADIVTAPPPHGPHEFTEYLLTITCIENCDHPVTYHYITPAKPMGLFLLTPNSSQLVVLWQAGGPAGNIQVYNLSNTGIKRVLDVPSRAQPEFSYAEDGSPIVIVDERGGGIEPPDIIHWRWNGTEYVPDRKPGG